MLIAIVAGARPSLLKIGSQLTRDVQRSNELVILRMISARKSRVCFSKVLMTVDLFVRSIRLRIEVNAAGTSVTFYIHGAFVGTHTTNIPTGSRSVGSCAVIIKSIGTTRIADIEASIEQAFTTTR